MLKIFILLVFFIVSKYSFSQDKKYYDSLIVKGITFLRDNDPKNAATTFSAAIRLVGNKTPIHDLHRAGFSWALANNPDSAFYYLELIGKREDLTLANVEGILSDEDYSSLYKDKRWNAIRYKLLLNQYKPAYKGVRGFSNDEIIDSVLAISLRRGDDSAFIMFNREPYELLQNKKYDLALKLFKLNIALFPENYIFYHDLGNYFLARGDSKRAYAFYSKGDIFRYKKSGYFLNSSLSVDSMMKVDYQNLSNKIGYKVLPHEYLVVLVAREYMKNKMDERALKLLEMNLQHYPEKIAGYKDLADYYRRKGDKEKAKEYFTRALILQYKLPENFFEPGFSPDKYLSSFYKKLSDEKDRAIYPHPLMVHALHNYFLSEQLYDKAEALLKLNILNHPNYYDSYLRLSSFYKSIGDSIRANEWMEQSKKIQNTLLGYGTTLMGDTLYDTKVKGPVCMKDCPVISIDEAHWNVLTAADRLKPLATLMRNDGFNVKQGTTPFSKEALEQINVMVTVHPRNITASEITVLKSWVNNGGSLLAVTDHDNFEINDLLESFGIETNEISQTHDSLHSLVMTDNLTMNPNLIAFTEKDKTLANHVIMRGRNGSEKIRKVQTFSGRTIIGPPGSTNLLQLPASAVDFITLDAVDYARSRIKVDTKGSRSHGVAFHFGKGKVVVISETATLTAQIFPTDEFRTVDVFGRVGMNTPGSDNKQFALNIVRWLTGYLK